MVDVSETPAHCTFSTRFAKFSKLCVTIRFSRMKSPFQTQRMTLNARSPVPQGSILISRTAPRSLLAVVLCGCAVACTEADLREGDSAACADGLDNDGDGLIDCKDGDCGQPCNDVREHCADGRDNDQNGAVDCDDKQCEKDAACVEPCVYGSEFDCPRGTKCIATQSGVVCVPHGSAVDTCVLAPDHDECLPGRQCDGTRCQEQCRFDEECRAGTPCLDQSLAGSAGYCGRRCLTQQDCETGETCATHSAINGDFRSPRRVLKSCTRPEKITAAGERKVGQSCTVSTSFALCQPELSCIHDTQVYKYYCMPTCVSIEGGPWSECPAGGECIEVMYDVRFRTNDWRIGLCYAK